MPKHSGKTRKKHGTGQVEPVVQPGLSEGTPDGPSTSPPRGSPKPPLPDASKRKKFAEFLKTVLEAIRHEGTFQEAEELLGELRRWGGDYLASLVQRIEEAKLAERLELLEVISRLEDHAAVPHLERLVFDSSIDLRAKFKVAEILEELGSPLERGLAECLADAVEVLEGLPGLRPESLHGSHPLFLKFLQLPADLRRDTLDELAASHAQAAFDVIRLFQSREPRLHAETIDALARIEDPRAADLLESFLEANSEKETSRRLRRALYRLRERGLTPKGAKSQAKKAIYRPSVTPPQGYLSAIDGSGSQMIGISRPQPRGMRIFFQGVCNDVQGLLDFKAFEASHRALKEFLKAAFSRDEFPLIEAPTPYCAHLLGLAYQRTQERQVEVPEDYPLYRDQVEALISTSEETPVSPVEAHRADILSEAGPELWRQSEDLLKEPEFAGWAVEEEALEDFAEEVRGLKKSALIVSPHQREGQVEEICRKAANTAMDEGRRERYGRRLDDMAYIFYCLRRKEAARLALSAADQAKAGEGEPADHPFLFGLVKRRLLATLEEQEAPSGEPSESSLIVSPYEQRETPKEPPPQRPDSPIILPHR